MQNTESSTIRFHQPLIAWGLLALVAGCFIALDAFGLFRNLSPALRFQVWRHLVPYLPELGVTLVYALSTTILQMLFGVLSASAAYYYWGSVSGWAGPPTRLSYLCLVPYFVPIATLAEMIHQWGLSQGVPFDGASAWLLLVGLSVWQFFPFVFLLILEQLYTIRPLYWMALKAEGAGPWEAARMLILPKIGEVFGAIFTLRLLWMYTKVDLLFYLFKENSVFATRFLHFQIFLGMHNTSYGPDLIHRSTVMILGAIAMVAAGGVGIRWARRASACQAVTPPTHLKSGAVPPAPIPAPHFAGGGILLACCIGAIIALPLVPVLYGSIVPNDLLLNLSRSELFAAWRGLLSETSLTNGLGRWFLQSLVLAMIVGAVYTLMALVLAYGLLRDIRLTRIGRDTVVKWITVLSYSVPIIAIAFPICRLAAELPCHSQECIYSKLLILHGFYIWPFCLWMCFRHLRAIRDRSEVAAICEGAGIARIFKMSVLPHFWRRGIVICALASAISFNELVFSSYIIQREQYYTLPVGMIHEFAAAGESGTAARLFVITATCVVMATLLAAVLGFSVRERPKYR